MNLAGPTSVSLCLLIGQKPIGLKARHAFLLGYIVIFSSLFGVVPWHRNPTLASLLSWPPWQPSARPRICTALFRQEWISGLTSSLGKRTQVTASGGLCSPLRSLRTLTNGRLLIADTNPPMIRIFDFAHRKYSEIELATIARRSEEWRRRTERSILHRPGGDSCR